jgi:hypothetical protein
MKKNTLVQKVAIAGIAAGLIGVFVWNQRAPLVGTPEEVTQKIQEREAAKKPKAQERTAAAVDSVGSEIKANLAIKMEPGKDAPAAGEVSRAVQANERPLIKRDLPVYGVKPNPNDAAPSSQWYNDEARKPFSTPAPGNNN